MSKKILFVCTGNTCRSPLAEVIAKSIIENKNLDFQVYSRGISVFCSSKASVNSQIVSQKFGLSLENHISNQITLDDLISSDYIFTMTTKHKNTLLSLGNYREKTFTIGEFIGKENFDIMDPFGSGVLEYENCAVMLFDCIKKIFEKEL